MLVAAYCWVHMEKRAIARVACNLHPISLIVQSKSTRCCCVMLSAGPLSGSCLVDADCATGKQCDLSTPVDPPVYRCTGGLDTDLKYGTCVAKPTVSNVTVPPCTRCNTCIKAVRASVEYAALNTTLSAVALGAPFYTACTAGNYSLTACRGVQAAIESSYKGNLACRSAVHAHWRVQQQPEH